jgi:hypothetical protein
MRLLLLSYMRLTHTAPLSQKQMLVDQVSAGLSRRASQQELLEKGVLKRPPTESKSIAAPAVALEKALNLERVGERIAQSINVYVNVASQGSPSKADSDAPAGPSLKERMQTYMTAARESSGAPKTPSIGPGIRERMRAYKEATISKTPAKEEVESKMVDSPTSIKDRMQTFEQEPTQSKSSSPRSPVVGGPSLKERMAAYQENATKKAVDIDPTEEGAKTE